LHFRLEKDGEQDYIVRSHGNYLMDRCVSVDLDLEPGTYSVLMKITAKKIDSKATAEQVIRETCRDRQDKLLQIGLAYDLAHAKGQIKETEEEKKTRLEREAKKKAADRQKRRQELRSQLLKTWEVNKKRVARGKRDVKRKEEHNKKVEARKAARAKATKDGDKASPTIARQDATEAANQVNKVDSPGTTETVKQDTPATTDESSADPKPEETKVEGEKAKAEESKPDETKPDETKPDETKSDQSKPGEPEPVDSTNTTDPPTKIEAAVTGKQDGKATIAEGNKEGDSANPALGKDVAAEDKAAQFEAALKNVPSDLDNSGAPNAAAPCTAPAAVTASPPSAAGDNNDWEYDSLASFNSSIDTDLDGFPPSPPPEAEAALSLAAPPAYPDEEDENVVFKNDPWNAVCVVGLRVYSKDEGLSVLIVRPKSKDDEDTPLDLDDNSKGASGETTKEEAVATGDPAQDETKVEIKEGGKPGGV